MAAVLLAVAPAAPAHAEGTTGRLLVSVHGATPRAAIDAAGARTVPDRSVPQIGLVTVEPDGGAASLHALAQRLRLLPGVASVEPERRASPRYTPNDPGLAEADPAGGGVPLEWWVAREGLPAAWEFERGAGAKVAVIDTGIDGSHPDLQAAIAGATDLDNLHNSPATYDESGHGTHVASLACARGDDAHGLVGAGLDCSLLVFKTDFSDSSVAKAIVDAADQGAQAVNMSFGTDGSRAPAQPIIDAIDYAYAKNVVLVAAAADDPVEEQGDPANVLQPTGTGADITQGKGLDVTAANVNDGRASFAGLGSQVSLAAYGAWESGGGGPRGILGAFPGNHTEIDGGGLFTPSCMCRMSLDGDNRYAYLQGTSMAAPQVTAVAALLRRLNPDLGAADVVRILKQTARRPAGGWTPDLGWGILDAGAAAAAARTTDLRAPETAVSAPPTTRARAVTLRLRAKDTAPAGCVASGVKLVRVYRKAGHGRWMKVGETAKATLRAAVTPGRSYAFYTRGIDKAGNVEAVPRRPDARVRAR